MIKTDLEALILNVCREQPKQLTEIFIIARADTGKYNLKYVSEVCSYLGQMGLLHRWKPVKSKSDHRRVMYVTTPEGLCQFDEWKKKTMKDFQVKERQNLRKSGSSRNENLSKYTKNKPLTKFLP